MWTCTYSVYLYMLTYVWVQTICVCANIFTQAKHLFCMSKYICICSYISVYVQKCLFMCRHVCVCPNVSVCVQTCLCMSKQICISESYLCKCKCICAGLTMKSGILLSWLRVPCLRQWLPATRLLSLRVSLWGIHWI